MERKKYCLIGEIADFDYHGFWGDWCSPKTLKAFIDTLNDGEEAEIEINSPGGSVIQGVEMANAIKNCKANVVAHVTGIAASMASVIACACQRIEMEEASFMMIHDPWGYCEGNAEEMRKQASVLDQMKAVIMSFYRGKFKKCSEEQIAALMADETWYTGNECLQNGLDCTVIASEMRAAASIVGHKFAKIPEGAAKFMTAKEITDEGRAEIEAAKAAAKVEAAQVAAEGAAEAVEGSTGNNQASAEDDWESRYKGASKKINELTAKLADVGDTAKARIDAMTAERDSFKSQLDAMTETADKAVKAVKDFEDQVKNAGYENLAALIGAVSGLKADLEKGDQALAECRQQLDHLKETRDLLTGSVLTPGNASAKFADFSKAVDALGYVEASAKYPELKKSYRRK